MFKGFVKSVTTQHIERGRVIGPPQHLFRIITDVNQYSSFLPFCSHSQILQSWDSGKRFRATLSIEFPPLLRETYISSVTACTDTWTVDIVSTESTLFDSLRSRWRLASVAGDDSCCDAELQLVVATSDPLLSVSMGTIIPQIAVQQVLAFQSRCQQLYRVVQ